MAGKLIASMFKPVRSKTVGLRLICLTLLHLPM